MGSVNTPELVLSMVHYSLGGNIRFSSRFEGTKHIKLVEASQSHKHCMNISPTPRQNVELTARVASARCRLLDLRLLLRSRTWGITKGPMTVTTTTYP
jgi:hypothetical protein